MTVLVSAPRDLDAGAVRRVAAGEGLVLSDRLLHDLEASRAATVDALDRAGRVYGVNTGMGLQSHLSVGTGDQTTYQDDLMLARAVGAEPWLDATTTRAVVATRLRTLLEPEVGASPALVSALAGLLEPGRSAQVPSRGSGAAGEIIPLAHLGLAVQRAGYSFEAKEGVAFLQGVPVSTARACLLAADARLLAAQNLVAAAGSIALVRAPRDPYLPDMARGDDLLESVSRTLLELVGDEPSPRMLQAPVSFRVVAATTTALLRSVGHVEETVSRALDGVTTSPALVDGRFVGTAGFDGFELAAAMDGARLAALHAADVTTARLHRLLDPRVTGLPAQLSAEPGRQAGLVTVHKRATGLVHEARRTAAPAAVGAIETSLGQEDVQSFGLEAAAALADCLGILRDVTACELLALHQAGHLAALPGRGSQGLQRLQTVLHKGSGLVSQDANDRAFGEDVGAIVHAMSVGWADDVPL